jgi:hypothetical protein
MRFLIVSTSAVDAPLLMSTAADSMYREWDEGLLLKDDQMRDS